MTTMKFTLSDTLKTELSKKGVYAYAVAFSGPDQKVTKTLVSDGTIEPDQLSLELPNPFSSGTVYVLVQQGGNGSLGAKLTPTHFTATASQTNLTVSAVADGQINAGDALVGAGIPAGTRIVSQTSGTTGGVGVYVTNNATTAAGSAITGVPQIGMITPDNAKTDNYSYQLFEATLANSSFDQGDISALNTFGFPSSYAVTINGDQKISAGFAPGQSGSGIYSALNSTQTYSNNGFASADRLAIGPATADNKAPFPASDWAGYVNALKNNADALKAITMVVPYAGGTSLQPGPMLSQYSVKYVASDPTFGNDFFWLVPNTSNGATNTDWIYIPAITTTAKAGSLADNIYVQNGPLLVYADNGKGQPDVSKPTSYDKSFTPNNADGAVAKYFVAGFDAGYWGGTGTSANPKDTFTSDLSKTWNWNVTYAYNATLTSNTTSYSSALSAQTFDRWAQEIQKYSNAYGYSYTDLVSVGGVNPQVTLWDPKTNANVAQIDIKLFSNGETLDGTAGFTTAPPIYVRPAGSDYSPASTPVSGNKNMVGFGFQFGLATLNFAPDEKTPAAFKFYAPGDAMADSSGFVSLKIPVLDGKIVVRDPNDPSKIISETPETGIWNILTVKGGPGNWSLASAVGDNPYSQQAGQFNIYNLPVTSDGTASWYQLEFGSGAAKSVFNLYGTADASGTFLPITGAGSNPLNFVIDHGVGITPSPQAGFYTLSFAPGGDMHYSIDTFKPAGTIEAGTTSGGTTGNDTLIGAAGDDSIHGGVGTDTLLSWSHSKGFTVRTAAGSGSISVQHKLGNEGTDTLVSVERIKFSDTTVDLEAVARTAGMSATEVLKVVDLYTAGLNRAPDALGLHYYAAKLAAGASLGDIAKSIFSSSEASAVFSATNTDQTFVGLAFQNALGHAPDAASLSYWVDQLKGGLQRTDFISALIAGAQGADKQYIANKEAVGAHFALTAGLNNANWARTVEAGVTGTAASVAAANAQTDAFAAVAAVVATTELVVQIAGIVP